MADQQYMVNPQSPVGIGPFAPVSQAQEVAMTPEALRMKIYEELLKQQAQKPQTQQAPLDQMSNRMGSKPFTGTYLTDKTNPANAGLPILPPENFGVEQWKPETSSTKPVAEKTEQAPQEPATQEIAPAQQEIQKAIQETVKTPEDEQRLLNALSRPTEDGTQSIAQRIAMIAMAVAPTAVGFALEGRKGAYLGAAATGKGLQEGTEAYAKEDAAKHAERKLEIEAKKAEKAAAAKNAFDKQFADREGNLWFYNENNEIKPVILPTGVQAQKSNEPTQTVYPSGEVSFKYPFERRQQPMNQVPIGVAQKQQEQPQAAVAQPKQETIGAALDRVNKQWQDLGRPGYIQDANVEATRDVPINATEPPPGMTREQLLSAQNRARLFIKKENDRQNAYKNSQEYRDWLAAQKAKDRAQREKMAKISSDKEGDKRFAQNVADLQKTHYQPMVELNGRMDFYLNEFDKLSSSNVTDGMVWQNYLKTIQGDQSVVRPGENEMAMQFMPVEQKIKSFINRYGKLNSIMTAELRNDVLNMFADMKRVRMARFASAVNDYYKEAKEQGREQVLSQRLSPEAKSMVNELYGDAIRRAPVLTPLDYKKLYDTDKLKNGFFFKDPTGKLYIFNGQQYEKFGDGYKIKTRGRVTEWEVPRG